MEGTHTSTVRSTTSVENRRILSDLEPLLNQADFLHGSRIKELRIWCGICLVLGLLPTAIMMETLNFGKAENMPVFNWLNMLNHHLPRLCFLISAMITSVFFLRRFRLLLDAVYKCHSARINFLLKITALKYEILSDNAQEPKDIFKELTKEDSPLILKKGETTPELEMERSESQATRGVFSIFNSILKKVSVHPPAV
jgi:hypothetical protein